MVSEEGKSEDEELESAARLLDERWPFGPLFFLKQLGSFVRDRCPDSAEELPVVHLHLADGEVLDLCHIIGIARSWFVLAVNEPEGSSGAPTMRTELVPYSMVLRVTIHSRRDGGHHAGFDLGHRADLVPSPAVSKTRTPEEALAVAAGQAPNACGAGASGAMAGRDEEASHWDGRTSS